MKINEVILQEGVFDKIKKAFSGPEPSSGEKWAKQIAGEWKKYLERLETSWTPYTHKLTTKQITDPLIKFVDKKLFGVYNLKDAPEDIKKSVLDSVRKLASEYPNVDPESDGYDKWVESEFLEILVQAQKLRDDPTVKPDPEKERRAKVKSERLEKQRLDLIRRTKELNAKKEREAKRARQDAADEVLADLKRQERINKYKLPPNYGNYSSQSPGYTPPFPSNDYPDTGRIRTSRRSKSYDSMDDITP